jgi:peptidoglycan/xylan/chitin deacetylase (PgdA/CDA1 family)
LARRWVRPARSTSLRLSRAFSLWVLGVAGYASSCAAPKIDGITRVAVITPNSTVSTPVDMDPTVVDAASLPSVVGPVPYNPEADPALAGILAEGAESSGEIALTFDDGPAAETTSEVLRILAAHKVKGAFFLTGHRLDGVGVVPDMNRAMARAIVAAGHTLGNHGLDHVAVNKQDYAWNLLQIEESARLITDATGVPLRYFRPPYGKIGDAAQSILVKRRDELVMWTIDAQDTRENDPEKLTARLVSQLLFAGQGVVLLHDLRGPSVRALSLLLDWLAAHPRDSAKGTGYTVVDLPTYLAHAAARPWPYATRLALYHAREKLHAIERLASKPKRKQ